MHIVKSVGVLSVAKIFGMIHGCMGLIFLPFFLIFAVIGSFAGSLTGQSNNPFAGILGTGRGPDSLPGCDLAQRQGEHNPPDGCPLPQGSHSRIVAALLHWTAT